MRKILMLLLCAQVAHAQMENRTIKEKDVRRIIQALSADELKGRSSTDEKSIFKAAALIEKEFQKIGLTYLPGLTSYIQPFQKLQISPATVDVTIGGKIVNPGNVILISEKKEVILKNNLQIKTIAVDNSVDNKDQYFFNQAFQLSRDTASYLVLVDSAFKKNFNEFKGYFKKSFAREENQQKYSCSVKNRLLTSASMLCNK